jgi:hypothetical protein
VQTPNAVPSNRCAAPSTYALASPQNHAPADGETLTCPISGRGRPLHPRSVQPCMKTRASPCTYGRRWALGGPGAGENNYFWRPTGAGHLEMSVPTCGSVRVCTASRSKSCAGGRRNPYLPDFRAWETFTPMLRPAVHENEGLALHVRTEAGPGPPGAGENNYSWRPTGAGHLEMSFPACGSVHVCTGISAKPCADGRRDTCPISGALHADWTANSTAPAHAWSGSWRASGRQEPHPR